MTQINTIHTATETENHSKIEEIFIKSAHFLHGNLFRGNLTLGENHGFNSTNEILECKFITTKEEKIEYIHLFRKYIKEWEASIKKHKVEFKKAQRDGGYAKAPSCMENISFHYELRHFLRDKFNDE